MITNAAFVATKTSIEVRMPLEVYTTMNVRSHPKKEHEHAVGHHTDLTVGEIGIGMGLNQDVTKAVTMVMQMAIEDLILMAMVT